MNDSRYGVNLLRFSFGGMSASILACMVVIAVAWHWFGGLGGSYRFDLALIILVGEMNRAWSWTLVVFAALWMALFGSEVRVSLLRCLCSFSAVNAAVAGLVILFYGYIFGVPDRLLDGISLLLVVVVSCQMMGGGSFLKTIAGGLIGYLLVGYVFTVIKGGVFLGRSPWDAELMMVDQWIFGGLPHQVVAGWAQQSIGRLVLAEDVYLKLFAFMLIQLVVCALVGGRRFAERYGTALMILYFIGAISYYAIPAWGPFVADRGIFTDAVWSPAVWEVASIQSFILNNSQQVAAGDGAFSELHPYAFVAAMPSLHMAVPALAFWLWLPWKHLTALAVLICAFTAFSALATGMHYAVDLLAGFILAGASIVVADKIRRLSQGREKGARVVRS